MSTEAKVQSLLALEAARIGCSLWRNNSGAHQDDTGRWIRYGLGNTSKKLNDAWKSSDLIGITPVLIRPEHLGHVFGVFTVTEVKDRKFKGPRSKREVAQNNFIENVKQLGGFGMFATSIEDYHKGIHYG